MSTTAVEVAHEKLVKRTPRGTLVVLASNSVLDRVPAARTHQNEGWST